jgi:hypothetical protein
MLLAVFVRVTVAPATAAPFVSVMRPRKLPLTLV